jgi:hypothetical protein
MINKPSFLYKWYFHTSQDLTNENDDKEDLPLVKSGLALAKQTPPEGRRRKSRKKKKYKQKKLKNEVL